MKERLLLKSKTVPIIPSHVRFEYDGKGKKWVLLAPDRALFPDKIAVQILKKCNGKDNIQNIAEDLAKIYKAPAEKIIEDIKLMLQDLADKGFLKEC